MENSSKLNKKLFAYAAMAAAVPAVQAQIVYQDLDPDIVLGDQFFFDAVEGIDMDLDGIDDFVLGLYYDYGYTAYPAVFSAYLLPFGSNKVAYMDSSVNVYDWGLSTFVIMNEYVAEKIDFGDVVDDSHSFSSLKAVIRSHQESFYEGVSPTFGQWLNDTAYAAFQLMIDGEPHYGWIQIGRGWGLYYKVISVLDYGYNPVANEELGAGVISGVDRQTQLYPMPAKDQLYIRSQQQIDEVHLYSAEGNRVLTVIPDGNTAVLYVDRLKPGVYLLMINGKEETEWERVVVL